MLKNKIEIMSRAMVEKLMTEGVFKNTSVISFYNPKAPYLSDDYAPVCYDGVCDRVFYVELHDIDIEVLPDFNLTFDTYFPEADKLAEYIIENISEGRDIICQCEYGQSRSSACAAAIKEYYDGRGIDIFADYRYYPNQLVFNKLLCALKEKGSRDILKT